MSSCLGTELARKLSMLRGMVFFTYVCYMLLQVALVSGVDSWLAELSKSINESLYFCIVDCVQDIESGQSIEEWISKVHVLRVLNTKKRFPQKPLKSALYFYLIKVAVGQSFLVFPWLLSSQPENSGFLLIGCEHACLLFQS